MILKIVNVDKTFVRTCERSNTFANADERLQKINVNVQNSNYRVDSIKYHYGSGKLKLKKKNQLSSRHACIGALNDT